MKPFSIFRHQTVRGPSDCNHIYTVFMVLMSYKRRPLFNEVEKYSNLKAKINRTFLYKI